MVVVEMKNITKQYPLVLALDHVDFSLKKGEILSLLGENGAGKSTLMKILYGICKADEGEILVEGKKVNLRTPKQAIDLGIGMVHQHFMLTPVLSVTENIVVGQEPVNGILFDKAAAEKEVQEMIERYGFHISASQIVKELSVGEQQKVEILKALLRGAKILILDEPTAVLTPQETDELFVQLKLLKENGHTIIFISHKLKEIKQICDRITILRHGKSMGEYEVKDLSEQDISKLMVGRDVVLKVDKGEVKRGERVLRVRDLCVQDDWGKAMVKKVSFDICKREILGVAGIEGNGQREIAEAVTGLIKHYNGNITVKNHDISKESIRKIRDLGLSHIPEDRMTYGVSADSSILDNIISNRFYKKEYNNSGMLKKKKIFEEVDRLINDYLVKCDGREQTVRMLSGGNIQKVVVARECSSQPDIIVVNQPTRGIDVGAIEFVRKHLVELRDMGAALLLISADLNEILELSDRLLVLCEGEIVAYFSKSSEVSEQELGEYMLGLKRMTNEQIGGAIYGE